MALRLVRPDLRLMDAAVQGDDALAAALGHGVAHNWAGFPEAIPSTRDGLAADPGSVAWGTRLFVTGDPPELVGWGGFKGPPDDHGVVEIGYAIADERQGRGLATAAAEALVAEAFDDDRVRTVIAHTLPERNASNRVLEKAGFRHDGDVEEDGQPVWRFSRERA